MKLCIHLDNSAPLEYGTYCAIDRNNPIKIAPEVCNGCESYCSSAFEYWWISTGYADIANRKLIAKEAWERSKANGR
jgi:hypothetical protein